VIGPIIIKFPQILEKKSDRTNKFVVYINYT